MPGLLLQWQHRPCQAMQLNQPSAGLQPVPSPHSTKLDCAQSDTHTQTEKRCFAFTAFGFIHPENGTAWFGAGAPF